MSVLFDDMDLEGICMALVMSKMMVLPSKRGFHER